MSAARPLPPATRHVSLLAVPDAVVSTLAGIYDVMNARAVLGTVSEWPRHLDAAPPSFGR